MKIECVGLYMRGFVQLFGFNKRRKTRRTLLLRMLYVKLDVVDNDVKHYLPPLPYKSASYDVFVWVQHYIHIYFDVDNTQVQRIKNKKPKADRIVVVYTQNEYSHKPKES